MTDKHSHYSDTPFPSGTDTTEAADCRTTPEAARAPRDMSKIRMIAGGCLGIALLIGLTAFLFDSPENLEPVVEAAPVSKVVADAEPLAPLSTVVDAKVARGDTLMSILTDAGADRVQAYKAIRAMADLYSPRKIKPGHELSIRLEDDPSTGEAHLDKIMLKAELTRNIRVTRIDDGSYRAEAIDIPVEKQLVRAEGTIDTSLYMAALGAEVPMKVLSKMINIFSFDVDFQREIRSGDRFALMYEEMRTEDGQPVDQGAVLMAEMDLRGDKRRYYRFKGDNDTFDYYDAKGRSVRKALLKTPVDGARISSHFGKRKHPILGYTKQHTGTDFAARRGTPIYASGDGTIEFAGWNGGYGKYIRIRHNGTFKSAYAHMKGFAKGIRAGKRVRQRQVIGYVGTTGRSTGPHLHYEVHKHNRKVNPLSVKLPTGKTLTGNELAAFQNVREKIERKYAALPAGNKLADASQAQ